MAVTKVWHSVALLAGMMASLLVEMMACASVEQKAVPMVCNWAGLTEHSSVAPLEISLAAERAEMLVDEKADKKVARLADCWVENSAVWLVGLMVVGSADLSAVKMAVYLVANLAV